YGRAEALLERKWPEKYNPAGHLTWNGRLYGSGLGQRLLRRPRIYHGTWGSAPFQSLYERQPGALSCLPLIPEWYLMTGLFAAISGLGVLWRPLLVALPLLVLALLAQLVYAGAAGLKVSSTCSVPGDLRKWQRALVVLLFLGQPLARLTGRIRHGLTPWRRLDRGCVRWPLPATHAVWSERWRSPEERLAELESDLREVGTSVLRGRDFDRWDLVVRGGAQALTRIRMAIEEHGTGRQLIRYRVLPRPSLPAVTVILFFLATGLLAALDGAPIVAAILGAVGVMVLFFVGLEAAVQAGRIATAIEHEVPEEQPAAEPSSEAPIEGVTAADPA
ncbi:MAG: glycosyl transferase, partial [Actinobacteria bacterium]|nr:glycosyl transferase [Actinomycetota bacterium]